jgi:hypothetical protein
MFLFHDTFYFRSFVLVLAYSLLPFEGSVGFVDFVNDTPIALGPNKVLCVIVFRVVVLLWLFSSLF